MVNLKRINQQGIKSLLKDRLANGISSDVADQFKKYIADLNII